MEDERIKECMLKWAQNIGHMIEVGHWSQISKSNIKITKSVIFKEKLYEMLYRWHMTPEKLAKMYQVYRIPARNVRSM